MNRTRTSRRRRAVRRLAERDGWQCAYCHIDLASPDLGLPADRVIDTPEGVRVVWPAVPATIDHYTPKGLGGRNDLSNCRLSCEACNTSKGMQDPADWGGSRAADRAEARLREVTV